MADPVTIIAGQREFTCHPMNAFAANKLLLRLQKIVVPVFGAMAGTGKALGDVDVKEAAEVIAQHLNESTMDDIVLPMFAESKLYSIEDKRFIKSGTDIDVCFTVANLFEMYELIFEVAKFQFGPFFLKITERFGAVTAAVPAKKAR